MPRAFSRMSASVRREGRRGADEGEGEDVLGELLGLEESRRLGQGAIAGLYGVGCSMRDWTVGSWTVHRVDGGEGRCIGLRSESECS
jgi:hypothetical protein